MKLSIEVEILETGNPRIGYHDHTATIHFSYTGDTRWTPEKEGAVVASITGGKENWMWHKMENIEPGWWKGRFGYDSGD